jgi:NIPSNAP
VNKEQSGLRESRQPPHQMPQKKSQQEARGMIIEMRTYKLKPGKREEFLEIFRTKSMPAHAEIGMKILGPWLSIDDPDTFFFMRGFPDLASREPMKAKFYEGELWKTELEQVLMPLIEKYDVVLVDDSQGLVRW